MADVGVGRRGATTSWAAARMAPEEGPMELRNVNAVVTGGASGLGRATAERLVAAGGRVALLDRPASAGADVAKTLGPSALFTAADVTRADDVASGPTPPGRP